MFQRLIVSEDFGQVYIQEEINFVVWILHLVRKKKITQKLSFAYKLNLVAYVSSAASFDQVVTF